MSRYCKAAIFLFTLCGLTRPLHAQVELIVRLRDDAPLHATMRAGRASLHAADASLVDGVDAVRPLFTFIGPSDDPPAMIGRTYLLSAADSAAARQVFDRWAASPEVAYVQYNHRYRLDAAPVTPAPGPDPDLDSLRHLVVIRASEAWALTDGRPEVRIGFVDTGVYLDHPDLTNQFWINPGEDLNGNGQADPADWNGLDDDGNGYVDDLHGYDFVDRTANVEAGDYTDRDADPSDDPVPGGGRGHGTIVAGVLAAARDNDLGGTGVAPGCRMVPLRAFGADGLAEDDDVAAAILYAADVGLEVLNLSFGDVYISPLMHESIRYAVQRGTVVVASAGNVGGTRSHYPSDYPEVISTAWLNEDGTGIAGRGTYGVGIDLGAPGTAVYTTLLPQEDTPEAPLYGRRSGSSIAAPMVAAAAALLKSVQPDLSPAAIRSILTGSAVDVDEPGWDDRTAAGRLDVVAALYRALPGRTEIRAPAHDGGVTGGFVPVLGTAVDAGFSSVQVFVAIEDSSRTPVWQALTDPITQQIWNDTLAVWHAETHDDGAYLLRVVTALKNGRTVEVRHRVYLDRSPPQMGIRVLDAGIAGEAYGIVADVAVDDVAAARLDVELNGTTYSVSSDRKSKRLGLSWTDPTRRGGEALVRLTATNAAGLSSTAERTLQIPSTRFDPVWLEEDVVSVPHGFLLPTATDFDRDGLLEIILNQYQDGWIGDTLATYEWDGDGFTMAQRLVANVIPRDVGDADGDGLQELLTQVTGVTLLLEQEEPSGYPVQQAYLDTTGLANPFDDEAAFGALITDLDQDGRGELLVHNTRAWRVLEYDGSTFTEVARLANPTSTDWSEVDRNEFQEPEALVGDPDGDGRLNLLVGDSDGDWILYENAGDDTYDVVWTSETTRYNAGSRLASGDFDGDGLPEFVTFTQNWTQATREGTLEPPLGRYFLWDGTSSDTLALVDSLSIWGNVSRHGSVHAVDFDSDGRDELVLLHPPDLHVFSWSPAGHRTWHYARTGSPGQRSMAMVAADWDGDGTPELLAAGADGRMHRFSRPASVPSVRPPQWVGAVALDARRVRLEWFAPDADSVTVFRGAGTGALAPLATVSSTIFVDETVEPSRYALRAWWEGDASPLSPVRHVRPHAPATVEAVTMPVQHAIHLLFSELLAAGLRPEQFRFDGGIAPRSLLLARQGRGVVLAFDQLPAEPDTLRWDGVVDREGTPVGQTAVLVEPSSGVERGLHLVRWDVLGLDQVLLVFSEPLDPDEAKRPANYRIVPRGHVAAVRFDPERPEEVVVQVEGQGVGPTGVETALVVHFMRSASGNELAAEGHTASLVQPAEDLAKVYVYPNPWHLHQHEPRVMIAGLPIEANIQVFSVQGGLVKQLTETDGNGGVVWDLTDERGTEVPSGVYLVRVETTDGEAVLRKVAVIR